MAKKAKAKKSNCALLETVLPADEQGKLRGRDLAHDKLKQWQKSHPAAECRDVWSDALQVHITEIWSGPETP